jgi:hypothetical protein
MKVPPSHALLLAGRNYFTELYKFGTTKVLMPGFLAGKRWLGPTIAGRST